METINRRYKYEDNPYQFAARMKNIRNIGKGIYIIL